jgi:hypothetical protein
MHRMSYEIVFSTCRKPVYGSAVSFPGVPLFRRRNEAAGRKNQCALRSNAVPSGRVGAISPFAIRTQVL